MEKESAPRRRRRFGASYTVTSGIWLLRLYAVRSAGHTFRMVPLFGGRCAGPNGLVWGGLGDRFEVVVSGVGTG